MCRRGKRMKQYGREDSVLVFAFRWLAVVVLGVAILLRHYAAELITREEIII